VKKALANEQLFDQVAREWSVDASAETGGDLGYFTPEMVDLSFWEACVKAKPGRQVPTSTPLGHHIIQVLDKREGGSVKDLMEVREEIRQRILSDRRQARQEALLEKLRGETSWSLDPEVLQKTAAR
jgi:parvulin-like peptidyl-prolyl isomerase